MQMPNKHYLEEIRIHKAKYEVTLICMCCRRTIAEFRKYMDYWNSVTNLEIQKVLHYAGIQSIPREHEYLSGSNNGRNKDGKTEGVQNQNKYRTTDFEPPCLI